MIRSLAGGSGDESEAVEDGGISSDLPSFARFTRRGVRRMTRGVRAERPRLPHGRFAAGSPDGEIRHTGGIEIAELRYAPTVVAHHHPSPAADRPGRRSTTLRNDLWTARLRRPVRTAARESGRLAREASARPTRGAVRRDLGAARRGRFGPRLQVAVDLGEAVAPMGSAALGRGWDDEELAGWLERACAPAGRFARHAAISAAGVVALAAAAVAARSNRCGERGLGSS
jgi:hypothetical protein